MSHPSRSRQKQQAGSRQFEDRPVHKSRGRFLGPGDSLFAAAVSTIQLDVP